MGKLVVMEGAEYWAYVRLEKAGLDWILVTASKLLRQQSSGPACYGVLQDRLRFLGAVRRVRTSTPMNIPQASSMFVEVTKEPGVPGQDVWPMILSNMW